MMLLRLKTGDSPLAAGNSCPIAGIHFVLFAVASLEYVLMISVCLNRGDISGQEQPKFAGQLTKIGRSAR
jgi:hypothetical protein